MQSCLAVKSCRKICRMRESQSSNAAWCKFLLLFDVVKAFLNIGIREIDQDKLMILWYKDVMKGDYSLVGYKYTRLPFGLRPSPTLLMLCLFKILVFHTDDDDQNTKFWKKLIYDLTYMDNCSFTTNNENELRCLYDKVRAVFSSYKLSLQQFLTNNLALQNEIDNETSESSPDTTKLLGLQYNRMDNTIGTRPLKLDKTANSKRKVISSLASNYDVLKINGPLLNRARIFAHELQCQTNVEWDTVLSDDQLRDWRNICNQVDGIPSLSVTRSFGMRTDNYQLIAFTDASS